MALTPVVIAVFVVQGCTNLRYLLAVTVGHVLSDWVRYQADAQYPL